MSDSNWEDLVSVIPIKNQHLPRAAVEDTAYSSWLPDINSMFPSSCLHFSNSLFLLSPTHKNTLAICQSLWALFFAAVNYLDFHMAPQGVSGFSCPLSLAPFATGQLCFWWQPHFFLSFPPLKPYWWSWLLTTFFYYSSALACEVLSCLSGYNNYKF